MDHIAIVLVCVAALNAILAAIVLRAGAGKETNRVFAAASLSVGLWTFTNACFRLATTEAAATLWAQLAYASALTLGAAFLHFSWTYPERRVPRKANDLRGWKFSIWAIAVAIGALAFVPGVTIQAVDVGARRIDTSIGVYLVAGYMLSTSTVAFSTFFKNQRRLTGRRQAQARYVLFGAFLTAILGLFFNLLLPLLGNYTWVWLGPTSSLLFVGFTVYSIVAHRLFDVRVLIRHTLAYSFVLAFLAGSFAALEKGIEHFVRPLVGPADSFPTELIAALLVGFATEPVQRWAKATTRRWLFRGESAGESDD